MSYGESIVVDLNDWDRPLLNDLRDEDDHDDRKLRHAFRYFYNLDNGNITVDQIPNEQLLAVAKYCCEDKNRKLYFEVMRKIHEQMTDQMAEDVYDLFHAIDKMYYEVRDEWFEDMAKHFSNTEWQSGRVIPMSLMNWRKKATENALKSDNVFLDRGETGKEYVMFLPRNLLLDHLATFLSKNARDRVQCHLLSNYPRHIRQFLRDSECLQNVSNQDVLFELLKLASEFEIEALYFRAYARMVLLDLPLEYIPPLHLHEFSAEEVLEQKASDQSPFTKLIAKDGSSAKVLEKDLLKKVEYFRFFSAFHSEQTLSVVHSICKDIKVLETWIQFLHNDELSIETKEQTLVDSIEVADYYQIDGMLFALLFKLDTGLRHATARMVYEHLPFHYKYRKDDELRKLNHSMKKRLEKDFLEEISDSQRLGQPEAPRLPEVVNSCRDTDKDRAIWLNLWKSSRFFPSNKCLRELEGVDKLFEIETVSSCSIILYQRSSETNFNFFNFDLDYNFEQMSIKRSNLGLYPVYARAYLHQRKLFILNNDEPHVWDQAMLKVDVPLVKSPRMRFSIEYVIYLGTIYAFPVYEKDEEVKIYKYDNEGNCWINMKIHKHLPLKFRDMYLVFGDLLVAIYKDEWVAYLKPSSREDFDFELNCFETFYPKNTFENVIGIHKKKMEEKKYFWLVFKRRSFLILRADDLKLLAEVELPLINNWEWEKAISSGEQVYLVLELDEHKYLDIYEATIELNEGNFENTKVKINLVIESQPHSRNNIKQKSYMGVIERIVID